MSGLAADESKTEKPTPKKIRDARREGQFPRTPDAAMWAGLAAGTALVPFTARLLTERFQQLLAMLPQVAADPTAPQILRVTSEIPMAVLACAAPVCGAATVGALMGTAMQGTYPSTKALKPKGARLNPKEGLKRMFGARAAWEAVKALTKVVVIAVVAYLMARHAVSVLLGGWLSVPALLARSWTMLRNTLWAVTVVGALVAVADYAYQRHTVMKQLRMTPRDIKDEMKQAEGDPLLKGAIRSRQMAVSRNRMLAAVSTADVVLVNPTHLAVALTYEASRGAPTVVAKGAGTVAAKIRARAHEHRIPVVEDKPLARALHRICEVGEEIPSELYLAVAKILAFVMSSGRPGRPRAGQQGRAQRPPSAVRVPMPRLPSKAELRTRRARDVRAARAARAGRPRRDMDGPAPRGHAGQDDPRT